ncbi:MAG: transcriptional regulator [Thermoplasmata archaeon]
MPFDLQVRYSTPLTPISDPDEVLREFLRLIGYLPDGDEGRGGEGPVDQSLAYRLVRQCILGEPNRAWYIQEMVDLLGTSKPTLYRHINKLKTLDLLEEVGGPGGAKGRKGYRLRYGNLARAWDFTEAHAQNALKRYRETVDHLQSLIDRGAVAAPVGRAAAPRPGAKGGSR